MYRQAGFSECRRQRRQLPRVDDGALRREIQQWRRGLLDHDIGQLAVTLDRELDPDDAVHALLLYPVPPHQRDHLIEVLGAAEVRVVGIGSAAATAAGRQPTELRL